ncbi:MAG TPA: SIS domain-containing protein [Actinoplanes sp.]|nr:SIS domain-containing protein [Actinoplanes sp.]
MPAEAFRDQVFSLPQLIRDTTWAVEDRARSVLSTPDLLNLRLAVLTGSGDSHIAARAGQYAWQALGGVPTFVDDAMTAARYRLDPIAAGQRLRPLLVAVSNSGEVARVVEAAGRARAEGAAVLAVTGSADNRLARAADATLLATAPPFAAAPGVRSYAMSLLGLYHLAIRVGEVRGRYTMDEAHERRRQLAGLADTIEAGLDAAAAAAAALAEQWAAHPGMDLLGSGPGRASADYGAAKLLEASGIRAYGQDIEEFVHLHYFAADTTIPVVLVTCGTSAARSRAAEVAKLLETLGRPAATLSDEPLIGTHLPHAADVPEIFQPLLHIAPLALLADEIMRRRGEQPGRGGRDGWIDSVDGATTRGSAISLLTPHR